MKKYLLMKGIDMKKIGSVIFLLVLVLFLLASCDNSSSDWVKYKDDNEGNIYLYNKENIAKDCGNYMVQVWGKQVYSNIGREKEIQSRTKDKLSTKGYDKLLQKNVLYEIDCKKQMISILAIIHYDTNGKALYSGGTLERKWFDIKPDSTEANLQKEVCPNK
jgi:hypothetical protein